MTHFFAEDDPLFGAGLDTLAVRAGQHRTNEGENSEALFLTSSFVFKSAAQAAARFSGTEPGNIYSRFTNPTVRNFEERLAALDAAAATDGALGEDARQQAESAAHKLAGSLGMYGYDDGTRIARLLEQLLESSTPEPERLRRLTAELRATIFPDS